MKILVFSDSHGNERPMAKAINAHPDASALVFLGDGMREAESLFAKYPNIPSVVVRGNCDWYGEGTPSETVVDFDGTRVLCMHGHRLGVKSTLIPAAKLAKEKNANLVLFGHTHTPIETVIDEVRLFNPGSVGVERSYGVVYIEKGKIVCSHGTAEP